MAIDYLNTLNNWGSQMNSFGNTTLGGESGIADSFLPDLMPLGQNKYNGYDSLSKFGLGNNTLASSTGGATDGFNWEGAGSLLSGIGGVAQAGMGFLNYGLSRDQFDITKKYLNRTIENDAITANENFAHKAIVQNSTRPVPQLSRAPIA